MSLTIIFCIITVVMSVMAWQNQNLLSKWILNPKQISEKGEYYRFLTSGFIHADWGHLFFNMFTFYSFGSALERILQQIFGSQGQIYFAVLYLLGIIISDIPTYLKQKNNGSYNALGASGGVSAIVFASILFFPTGTLYVYFFPMPAFIFAILFFAYSVFQMQRGQDNINHSAHLWGAVFGAVFMLAVYPASASIFMEQMRNWKLFS